MNFDTPMDEGLSVALNSPMFPTSGLVLELGCGTARNLRGVLALSPDLTGEAYDLNSQFIAFLNDNFADDPNIKDRIKFELADIYDFELSTYEPAMIILSTAIYWPKSIFIDYLKNAWDALNSGGVLHIEFATTSDSNIESDFFLYTCEPFPEDGYENSYYHYCGSALCSIQHPGVLGASFWKPDEVISLVSELPGMKLLHVELKEWTQLDEREEEFQRSFFVVTLQKLN